MAVDIEIAYWLGLIAHAGLFVLYVALSLYEGDKTGAHKLAIWPAISSLLYTILNGAALHDIGIVQRADAVEFNVLRWIAIVSSAVLAGGACAMVYLWHATVDGWAMLGFGALSSLFFLACGLDTGDRRIVWFVAGAVYLAAWAVYAFFYANYRHANAAQRSKGSKFMAFVYSLILLAAFLFAAFILLFSVEFVNKMTIATREWRYLLATLVLAGAPLIARFDYRPVPLDMKHD